MLWKNRLREKALFLGEHCVASVYYDCNAPLGFTDPNPYAVVFFLPTLQDAGIRHYCTEDECIQHAEAMVNNWLHNALLREIK